MSKKKSFTSKSGATIVAIITSAAVVTVLHTLSDKYFSTHERDKNDYFVPSADVVKLTSLGFDHFLADLYWLAFVQYTGELDPRRGDEYRHAYDYVNLITNLDPHFLRPYWFGTWAIGYWQKRPDLADKIIQRGIHANPDDWEIPYLGGVNAFIFGESTNDNASGKIAAQYYRRAAKLPNAPAYLEQQARILESDAYPLVKRKHTLYKLVSTAKDAQAKAAYHDELIATLNKLYYEAPTERIRQEAKYELEQLGEDTSKLWPVESFRDAKKAEDTKSDTHSADSNRLLPNRSTSVQTSEFRPQFQKTPPKDVPRTLNETP